MTRVSKRVRTIAAEDVVPEHSVLAVVRVWLSMVLIMILYFVEPEWSRNIEARVVQASHESSSNDEECYRVNVARDKVNAQQVEVLTADELKWVHIDGVSVATTRRHLFMMVLMDKPVDSVVV